jgi:hypothetical protein
MSGNIGPCGDSVALAARDREVRNVIAAEHMYLVSADSRKI